MDIMMPEMDGFEKQRKSEKWKNLRLLRTAKAMKGDREKS
jgi:CheY-like chemotaxis protein